jgi:hypothetical protein
MGADYIRKKTANWKLFGYPLEFNIYIDGKNVYGELSDYYGVFNKKFTGSNNAELKASVSTFADRMKRYSLRFESGLIYMFEDKEETARLKKDVLEVFMNLNKRVASEQDIANPKTATRPKPTIKEDKPKKATVKVTKTKPAKKAVIKTKASKQTGSSNKKADAARKAMPPGKRTSASGKTYTETRKNRTDKKGSKI